MLHSASKSIIKRMHSPLRFLIASTLLFVLNVRSGMTEILESQIKTAYVLNFVKFTEWPNGVVADGKVTLCVAGNNVLDGTLATLNGRKAGAYELHVVHYPSETILAGHTNANSALSSCQVVFIGASEQRRFIPIIKSLGDSPVLTISDIDDFSENGGGIGLRYRENKIIFEVNLASVQRSKLRLPGQFLNLASYIFKR